MKRACAIVLVLLLTLSAVGCTGQNQQQDSVYKNQSHAGHHRTDRRLEAY